VSNLVEFLYPVPDYRRTPLTLLRWWESRRLQFNRVVGAAGLVTVGGISLLNLLPPHMMGFEFLPLLVGSAVYGLMANAFFTLGWGVEVAARLFWGRNAPDLGPILFRQGLIFSVGLTLFPLLIMTLLWMVQVVVAVAG
jgi:hypothetical protein